jgi:predicted nucleic acid-binding protein
VESVNAQEYSAAIAHFSHENLSEKDALLIIKMEKQDTTEVYSFDKHLDGRGLMRLID